MESFLLLSSYAFDSSVAGIFWTLCQGGKLVLPLAAQESNPAEWGRIVAPQAVSHLLCLPSLYSLLLETGQPEELRSLKSCDCGRRSLPASSAGRTPPQTPPCAIIQ